jgi:hypothetical protein
MMRQEREDETKVREEDGPDQEMEEEDTITTTAAAEMKKAKMVKTNKNGVSPNNIL